MSRSLAKALTVSAMNWKQKAVPSIIPHYAFILKATLKAEWTTEKEFDRPSTVQVEKLVAVMNDDYVDDSEMMKRCSIVRHKTMHDSYIAPALAYGSIERKYPEQPNHPKQMYHITEKAKTWKKLDIFLTYDDNYDE